MTDRFPDSLSHYEEAQPETFRADLPRRRPGLGRELRLAIVAGVCGFLAVLLGASWLKLQWLADLPAAPAKDALWSYDRAPGMTFLDRNSLLIAARGPRQGRRVALKELPAYAPRAFLAAEDPGFYSHGPVDWPGVARAALSDGRSGAEGLGGSTLTQELARTFFARPEQSLRRTVQEAALARELGRRLSRDQILELYLNRVFFGASAYGIEAASRTYFGKPAAALGLSEAALLAALPRAPSRVSPAADMPAALARSRLVLRRMAEAGWITRADEQGALAAPPRLAPAPPEDEDFGYVLDLAQAQAAALAGDRGQDLVVRLTVDRSLQTTASEIVRRVMETQGRAAGAQEASLVALSPDGGVAALVGGVDHRFSRFDRAVQAERQPGPAFGPFVYAAALEAGIRATDIRRDAPIRLGPWTPVNDGGGYAGPVTVGEALARSISTVAVRLAQEVGTDRVARLAGRFGLQDLPARPSLSMALGAYETNLLDLTSAYQVFEQDGRRRTPYLIAMITDSAGHTLHTHDASPGQAVYDPGRAAEMARLMERVVQRGAGARAAFGRPAAGETGATPSARDAWFVGFTPDWACGVWVGNDDDTPMNRLGAGDLPAEIWRRFMLAAHDGLPVRDFPFLGAAPARAGEAAAAPGEGRAAFYRGLAGDFARAAGGARQGGAR